MRAVLDHASADCETKDESTSSTCEERENTHGLDVSVSLVPGKTANCKYPDCATGSTDFIKAATGGYGNEWMSCTEFITTDNAMLVDVATG